MKQRSQRSDWLVMPIVREHVDGVQEVAQRNAFLPANGGPPGFHYRYKKRCVRVDGAEGRWGDGQKHVWLHFLFFFFFLTKKMGKNQKQKNSFFFMCYAVRRYTSCVMGFSRRWSWHGAADAPPRYGEVTALPPYVITTTSPIDQKSTVTTARPPKKPSPAPRHNIIQNG